MKKQAVYTAGFLILAAAVVGAGIYFQGRIEAEHADILLYIAAGFLAQVVDGAMGMAYGVTASSLLLGMGLPPAIVSSTVHAAECFTTGASALSHRHFGNIDMKLFRRLVIPGVIGAVIGAYVLSSLPGEVIKPYVTAYLLCLGVMIVARSFRDIHFRHVETHLTPLGFIGALADTIGGGGWGPIVTTNLLFRGNEPARTIGSVNAAEFFVTTAASVVFFMTMGFAHWVVIVGLAAGGVLAAPLAAWTCRKIPPKPLMFVVGTLVIGLSLFNLSRLLL